jgi:precorrin-6Y C5,15-methyltransferase (decarboxylating)
LDHRIDVIGIGADGLANLRPELRQCVAEADFLAGGERQLGYVLDCKAERFVIKDNLAELGEELQRRKASQRCVVLASGDPLFYGIGVWLVGRFGAEAVRIEPAASSMQLAFARIGLSWGDAEIASVHGRDLRSTLLPLLGKPLIGLFTSDGNGPRDIASFFREHRCSNYQAFVAENLGSEGERIHSVRLEELVERRFEPLNIVILQRERTPPAAMDLLDVKFPDWLRQLPLRSFAPGIPDKLFIKPMDRPEVMTHQEIRAVVVSKLPLLAAGDVVWEIGAGLGSVTVELAVSVPHAEIFALEKDEDRFGYLKANLHLYEAYNALAYHAAAPDGLSLLPGQRRPRLVFVGGSGGRLREILEHCSEALEPLGTFLADFVTIENFVFALEYFKKLGWWVEVTEVSVARSHALAGLTTMKPLRRVFILEATKPGSML